MGMFKYDWSLSEYPPLTRGKVFSTFACGGGSTMGYKLAGFDVIACNDIDIECFDIYRANHKPKYSFLCDIRDLKDLPDELYELDILDGSPPCSSFSLSGNRSNDWGKEKVFREGQKTQVLDDLFFSYIDLVKRLQPKVSIAENVDGILMGDAIEYVKRIYAAYSAAGYKVTHALLNSSTMGVPQARRRVFFLAIRNDLSSKLMDSTDLFAIKPEIDLNFQEDLILYGEIESFDEPGLIGVIPSVAALWPKVEPGGRFKDHHPKKAMFNYYKSHPNHVLRTVTAADKQMAGTFNHRELRSLSKSEVVKASTFPRDYNFLNMNPYYICGMSVPPVMMAQLANRVYEQWLSKI